MSLQCRFDYEGEYKGTCAIHRVIEPAFRGYNIAAEPVLCFVGANAMREALENLVELICVRRCVGQLPAMMNIGKVQFATRNAFFLLGMSDGV